MSASSKKKLRNQQEAAKMTERQLTELKEAKKMKLYTTAFVIVLVALLVVAVTIGVFQTIANSGVREKNTVAMTVGEHEISNAELSYYYMDVIQQFYSQNGSYAAFFGLDVTKPLDEQVWDSVTNETWADYFLKSAKDSVRSVYNMNDAAAAAGHTLTELEVASVDSAMSNASIYANVYGYPSVDSYLKTLYGQGADEESYRNYVEMTLMADSYYSAYGDTLTYEDAELRATEEGNVHKYASYTYNYYYLAASSFLEGGTTAEDGTVTYSDEENAAALAAAEEAAKTLVGEDITSADKLDAAIAALSESKDSAISATSTLYADYSYSSIISEDIANWVSDESRKEGDKAIIPNNLTTTAEDGTETVTTNGYYVVMFQSVNDNNFPLKNVRHILVNFEGGTYDEVGNVTYSDEEKAATMAKAEELLNEWKAGEATENSFAAMATLQSADTGSSSNGGLYENVYPGQMVKNFENWCFDEARKVGDTGIVESNYGYHVMYFIGDSDITYRDYQISNELKAADLEEWYAEIINSTSITDGDYSYINKDLVLSVN